MKQRLQILCAIPAFLVTVCDARGCDETQLTAQFVGFYQYGDVNLCLKDHNEGSVPRGQRCSKEFWSPNGARANQIIAKVKDGDGYGLKDMFETWVYVTNTDSEARKHFHGCPAYESYLNAGRHAVSCYPHGADHMSAMEIQLHPRLRPLG